MAGGGTPPLLGLTSRDGSLWAHHHGHEAAQRIPAPAAYHVNAFTPPYSVLAWPYWPFTESFTAWNFRSRHSSPS